MAYQVDFGTISKKENSTANGFTVQASANCSLKDPSDLYAPVFTFQGDFPITANYFHVPAMRRYYWITATTFVLGHWEITGKVDVLASFKEEIGAQTFIIERSALLHDDYIIDEGLQVLTNPTVDTRTWALGFSLAGSYIICAAGASGNKFYVLNASQWQALYSRVFTSQFLTDYKNVWDAIVTELQNTVFRPQDYIVRALWVPFPIPGGAVENISLGYTDTGVGGQSASPAAIWTLSYPSLSVPDHPQLGTYGAFVNSNRYRKINLFLPGYGNLALDADALASQNVLSINASCDLSGTLYYRVSAGGIAYCVSCNIGTDIGYTVTQSKAASALASVGAAAGSAAAGNFVGAAGGIGSALLSILPTVEHASGGGSAGVVAASPNIILSVESYRLDTMKNALEGRAYNKILQISATSGYLKCRNASVSCPGTQTEIAEINGFLNGGFYYE